MFTTASFLGSTVNLNLRLLLLILHNLFYKKIHSKLCFAKQYLFNIGGKECIIWVYLLNWNCLVKILGLCPEMNKRVTNPPLLQMEILKALPEINFKNSTIIHIFNITKHCEKCFYTGQDKGIQFGYFNGYFVLIPWSRNFLRCCTLGIVKHKFPDRIMFKGHGNFFSNRDEQYHNWSICKLWLYDGTSGIFFIFPFHI